MRRPVLVVVPAVPEIEHAGQKAGSDEEEDAEGRDLAGLRFEKGNEFARVHEFSWRKTRTLKAFWTER